MKNHEKYTIEYDRDEILNVLKKYSDNQSDIIACSILERLQVSKILNFKIPIRSILYFKLEPTYSSYIHKDYYLVSDLTYALNLPLFGCNDVSMKWFKQQDSDADPVYFPGPSYGDPTPLLRYKNAICIDEVNCNTPTVVKIDDWHNIANCSSDKHAGLISIRFKDLSLVPPPRIEQGSKV